MLRPPRCILFDLDGTLCDTDASVQAGVDGACAEAERLLGVDESAWRAANSEAAAAVWSANAQRWVDGQLTSLDLSTQIYARTLVAVDQDPALAPDFVDVHAAASSAGLKPYADVRPFLDAASAAGIPLALVTNGASDTQRRTLATIGLAEQFDAIVVSGEEGVSKPDPAIFELALRQLGIAAVDGWHIGDSLPSDVAGALGVGLGAVWINRDGRKRQAADPVPTEEIARLTDVLGVLG